MKAYFISQLFLAIAILGCSGNRSDKRNGSIHSKDNKPIDFASKGLENLNASGNMKSIICQTWDRKDDAADAAAADPYSTIDLVYRGYCLFSDGSMIKDPRGNMLAGTWTMNDKVKPIIIIFSLSNGETESYQLAYLMPYEMKLSRMEGNKKIMIDLGSEAIRYTHPEEDPFHISNNAWRFKPAKPESDEQIKQRLKSCIHFFILFYDQKINAHSDAVLFTGLPSCFKWYGGGIFLQKQSELQGKWVNSFYNKEQALKAYKLADKLLDRKYEWPKKEHNWLKLNVAVLRQMEKRLDSL
ncbi:MAG: hypothetical protein ABI741_14665 [Ferruginibacter sp.]